MARLFGTTAEREVVGGGRLFGSPAQAQDLTTPSGLQATAERAGLGEQAQKILETKGEKPEQIFSGGFIQDTFDTLNLLQHGVTGLIQGKGFAEGVKTRASFTEKGEQGLGDLGIPLIRPKLRALGSIKKNYAKRREIKDYKMAASALQKKGSR